MRTYLSSNRTTNHACRTGYTLDAADRRIRTALPDGSAWDYAYDELGQLTSAQRDSINAMAYAYDTIGNRQIASEDGTSTAYTANDLNQYTAINQEQPTYDADGNMLTCADCTYTWNAENRLIRAQKDVLRVEANYDYVGRRFEKKVFYGNTLTQHQYFIYDGYKLAAILDALDENRVTTTFIWQPTGPDTPLTMTHKGVTGYYLTDGNKNVLKILKSDGTELATYTYSPFGQTLSMTGPWARLNPFRFSSEYHDDETALIYYNYRHYSPKLGRWISRDPIEEQGGVNLYGFSENSPNNYWDVLGFINVKEEKVIYFIIGFDQTFSEISSSDLDTIRRQISAFEKMISSCCEDYCIVCDLSVKVRWDLELKEPKSYPSELWSGYVIKQISDLPGKSAVKVLMTKDNIGKASNSNADILGRGLPEGIILRIGSPGIDNFDNTLSHEIGHVVGWTESRPNIKGEKIYMEEYLHSLDPRNLMFKSVNSNELVSEYGNAKPDKQWCQKIDDYVK